MEGRRISVSSTTQLVPTNFDIELTTMAAHVPGHLEEPSFPDLDRVSTELVGIANTIQKPSSNHTDPGIYEPLLSAHREQFPASTEPELPRYATKDLLSRFLPEADPAHERARTFRVWKSRRSTMLGLQILFASVATTANIVFTVWAVKVDRPHDGFGTLYEGECNISARLNTAAHVVLNILASLFLGAGNFCMQVLVAPTPEEVREQHARNESFDIGIHSLQNLRNIHSRRRLLWIGLGLISTLLHLVWNSAIFPSIPFTQFPVAVVTEDFLTSDDDWAISRPNYFDLETREDRRSLEALRTKAHDFDRKENLDCIRAYHDPLKATAELVIVTNEPSTSYNGSSLVHGWTSDGGNSWFGATNWVCAAYVPRDRPHQCFEEWIRSLHGGEWKLRLTDYVGRHIHKTFTVRYCLMGRTAGPDSPSRLCGLHYNFDLLILIIILTTIDTGIICCVAWLHQDPTLVLIGDAISNSLESKGDFDRRDLSGSSQETTVTTNPIVELRPGLWPVHAPRWSSAVSKRTWKYSLCLFGAGILIGFTMLLCALVQLTQLKMSISLSSLWAYGLGKTNVHSIATYFNLDIVHGSRGRVVQVIFANSYQVMVSFLYLFYNNVLTRQVLADEMIRFLRHRKALRVSSPQNLTQRSTYFLSLPWKYAMPQMGLFVLLHWLVSQSAFAVQTRTYGAGPDGPRVPSLDSARLGFSAIGIVLSTTLGAILTLALILNSRRRYDSAVPTDFPQMASNSAAIAANCRRPHEDADAYLYPVQLGVVTRGLNFDSASSCKGRVTFSTDAEIRTPIGNEVYEMARWNPRDKVGFTGRAKDMLKWLRRKPGT